MNKAVLLKTKSKLFKEKCNSLYGEQRVFIYLGNLKARDSRISEPLINQAFMDNDSVPFYSMVNIWNRGGLYVSPKSVTNKLHNMQKFYNQHKILNSLSGIGKSRCYRKMVGF